MAPGLGQHVEAHQQQVAGNPGLERRAVELGDHQRAQHPADHAGHQQTQHQLAIHIAQPQVRQTGQAGGEDFRDVHAGAGHRGRCAGAEQEGGGGNSVGHAERAVDALCDEADGRCRQEFLRCDDLDDDGQRCGRIADRQAAHQQHRGEAEQRETDQPGGDSDQRMRLRAVDHLFDRRQAEGFVGLPDGGRAGVDVADFHCAALLGEGAV